MATSNGDVHLETAESFAKDYLKDLLDKKLSAFEEETLDLTIKSKYDDLEMEDHNNNNIEQVHELKSKKPVQDHEDKETLSSVSATVTGAEINPEPELAVCEAMSEAPVVSGVIEPGESTFHENKESIEPATKTISDPVLEPGIAEFKSELEKAPVEHATDLPPEPSVSEFQTESTVEEPKADAEPEPGISQFKSESEQKVEEIQKELEPGVSELTLKVVTESEVASEPVCKIVDESVKKEENVELEPNQEEMKCNGTMPPEPSPVCEMSMVGQSNGMEGIAETEEEKEEEQDTIAPMAKAKPTGNKTEDELFELQFNKMGLTKDWWVSKRALSEEDKEELPSIDKFRTIKQNIKKGNTRSLKERFEMFGKL